MSPSPLESAVRSLAKILTVAALVAFVGVFAATVAFERPLWEGLVGLALALAVFAAQWLFLHLAARDRGGSVVWVMVSYLAKIVLVFAGLYVPRLMGMDVRFPAVVVVIAVLIAAASEVVVMTRMRQFNVDAPPSHEAEH
ncbi:hypothetical protein [Schaalia vaccimaxillae]|uniref:hypothetical protein n=1 Tax=Schaalia vaccimaxillae TaxID=183916 RepID=UPI0003B6FD99|nr:hypothetical protein [Schaalia vaccimaxillae]